MENFHVIARNNKNNLFIKKDFDNFTKEEVVKWMEERKYKYNIEGEKFGGQVLKENEFFVKECERKDVILPKKD